MVAGFVPSGGGCGKSSPRLVKKLLDQGATSEWSARPLEPGRKLEQRALARNLRAGIIRRTDKGDYWVDQERWAACRTRQLRVVTIAVFASLLLMAILFVLGEI